MIAYSLLSAPRSWTRQLCRFVFLPLCLVAGASAAQAATINVPADQPTIQAAVNAASSGDTVLLADGTYTASGDYNIYFGNKQITVTSQHGAAATVIDCGGNLDHRSFGFYSGEQNAAVYGLTLKNGNINGLGGSVYIASGVSASFTDCIFAGNSCSNGGAIFNGGTLTLTNCVFSANSSSAVRSQGTLTLTNCTFSANAAGLSNSGAATLTNCLLYGDTGGEITGQSAAATYCDIQGGYSGTGNISADPKFVSTSNFHLQPSSPCVVAGTSTGAPAADLDGTPRSSPPSIGAYEEAAPTLQYVSVGPGPSSIIASQSQQFTATATYSDGTTRDVTGSTTWASSNPGVAAISSAGVATGLAAGTANITGTFSGLTPPATTLTVSAHISPQYVSPTGSDSSSGSQASPKLTLQAAVNAALSSDTIIVEDGVYTGPGNVDIDTGSKSLTIASVHGAAVTVLDCGGNSSAAHRGFYVSNASASLTLSGLTVKNGYEANGSGSGIFNSGTLTLTDCVLSGNSSANPTTTSSNSNSGGGLFNSGTATLARCAVVGNSAIFGGGIYSLHGTGISLSLTDCIVCDNSVAGGPYGGYGGGIYGGSAVTATNCVISGNTSDYAAGGFLGGSAGSAALTNCTLTGNSAPDGNGGGLVVFGAATLTNDIVFSNPGGSFDDMDTTATSANCDIEMQGGYPGTGNIAADPLFVSATDFHLQPGSPCLGAGTPSGAPATTLDGKTRPTPPAIGAFELTQTGMTHLLWDNTDGAASIWNYNVLTGGLTQNTYGPYPGWTAATLADGPDGFTRVLWDNTDGTASLWDLNNVTAQFSEFSFGPYPGWTATALSVGADDTTHVLWNNADGTASLWNYSTISGTFTQNTYGPYPGWTATALADGPDGQTRLLWDKSDGTASIWSLNNQTGQFTQFSFGPYSGWTAKTLSVGTDNTTHVLWNNADGTASLWNYSTASGAFTQNTYGPYAGWTAISLADGTDGQTRLLWDNTDGTASLWNLDNVTSVFSQFSFGPYGGWTATATASVQ